MDKKHRYKVHFEAGSAEYLDKTDLDGFAVQVV